MKPLKPNKNKPNWSKTDIIGVIALIVAVLGLWLGCIVWQYQIKKDDEAKYEALKQAIPKLRFSELHAYYVQVQEHTYQVGVIARILNKDATHVFDVNGLKYQGGFIIGGGNGVANTRNMIMYDKNGVICGKDYLKAGDEGTILTLLPDTVEMFNIQGVVGITFTGDWYFTIDDHQFILKPEIVSIEKFLSLEEWNKLSEQNNQSHSFNHCAAN